MGDPGHKRRVADRGLSLWVAQPATVGGPPAGDGPPNLELQRYNVDLTTGSVQLSTQQDPAEIDRETVLLIDHGTGVPALFTATGFLPLRPEQSGRSLLEIAAAEAIAWRRAHLRSLRQQRTSDRLATLAEQLSSVESLPAIADIVVQHTPTIVEGYEAILYLLDDVTEPHSEVRLRPTNHPRLELPLRPLGFSSLLPFSWPGTITLDDVTPGSPYGPLLPLFEELGAARLAHVAIGSRGLLILVERRRQREFDGEDWYRLHNIARQVDAALRRVQLAEEVESLSLLDHSTGIGNRRKMAVLLDHVFAEARRGRPLSILALRLLNLAELEAERGRETGLRFLRSFASSLVRNTRSADVVVRFDAEEFLLILAGTPADGARVVRDRLQHTTGPHLRFRSGIAEYSEEMASPTHLVDFARASVAPNMTATGNGSTNGDHASRDGVNPEST